MNNLAFIYPRTVSVLRPDIEGDMKYETLDYLLVTGLSNLLASIQLTGITGRPNTNLPADASNETYWNIFIPFAQGMQTGVIARGLILLRDKITDDLNQAYEVVGAYWDSFGYNLRCKLLSP